MGKTLALFKWVIFFLSFLQYAIAHVRSHPNRAIADSEYNWLPNNAEDDTDLRSFPYDREQDEFEEINDENLSDVDFSDEEDGGFGLPSLTNNKRDPNSAMQRSFKNEAGYYLIEGIGHTITGTKIQAKCHTNGIFWVGKFHGKSFVKSQSGWYLAIDSSGHVYMKDHRDSDTDIKIRLLPHGMALYRKLSSPTRRYFLSISPRSGTVDEQNLNTSNTAQFRMRYGSGC